MKKIDYNYFLIFAILLLVEILIRPFGDFPLNDDWCYAIPVRDMLQGLPLKLVNWGSMTLVTQLLWGFLFGKFFGFSFFVLRLSVLSLHLVASLVLYKMLTKQKNSFFGLILTLFYILNPLVLSLSNTFMTDVTFLSIAIFTLYFYHIIFEGIKNYWHICLAILFTILLILTRQIGLYLPLAFLIVGILKQNKSLIITASLVLFFAIISLQLYEYWLLASENKVNNYFKPSDMLLLGVYKLPQIGFSFYHRMSLYLFYVGIFLLPISASILIFELKNETKKGIFKMALFSLPLIICSLRAFPSFPFPNVMSSVSVGTKILYDNFIPNAVTDYTLYPKVAMCFKILGLIGAILLIFVLYFKIKNLKMMRQNEAFLPQMGLFSFILYAIMMAFSDVFMDRYILPVFLSVIFMFTYFNQNIKKPIFIFLYLFAIGLFGILTTHDYFAWNKVRNEAYISLIEIKKAPHARIHAGIDMWGWQNYKHADAQTYRNAFGSSNWLYIFTFLPKVENLQVYKKYSYQRYIPFGTDTIYIQTRP